MVLQDGIEKLYTWILIPIHSDHVRRLSSEIIGNADLTSTHPRSLWIIPYDMQGWINGGIGFSSLIEHPDGS